MARAKSGLTEKQERFIDEYLIDLNATQAYIRAGYSEKGAAVEASKLLRNPKIASRVRDEIDKRKKRTEITADNVLRELGRIVFSDIKDYVGFNDDGVFIIDSDNLTEDQSHCISEVSESTYKGERKRSFKLHDKSKAIDMALRHLGLYLDKSELNVKGKVSFDDIIALAEGKNGPNLDNDPSKS